MKEDSELNCTTDKEEIFWIITTFFSMSYHDQKESLSYFSLTKLPSDYTGDFSSGILSTLVWCYRQYLPDFENEIYQISIELYALLELIENHSIGIQEEGFGEHHLLKFESLEDEDIWELVRRLSAMILKCWGMIPYVFQVKLDLDNIGPEVF